MQDFEHKPIHFYGLSGSKRYSENPSLEGAFFRNGAPNREVYISIHRDWFKIDTLLCEGAIKLFKWICLNLEDGAHHIQIKPTALKDDLGYKTDRSVYLGINDLMKHGLIFRKEARRPEYFINVKYFFYGDAPKGAIQITGSSTQSILREE